jgi:hypothetical protein
MPTSDHAGGDGWCPCCHAHGARVKETAAHRTIGCAIATVVHRAWLGEWCTFTGETWARGLEHDGEILAAHALSPQRTIRRALILGLRPPDATEYPGLS